MMFGSQLTDGSLNICITTNGPGVLGGVLLTSIGILLLICALILSIIGQFRRGGIGGKRVE